MTWTSPITWSASLVTVAQFNEQIRDNLNALKNPPSDNYELNEASNYTTSSTTFVDVDSTNLSLTIITTGGDVLVGFVGSFSHNVGSGAGRCHLNIWVDSADIAGDDGICLALMGDSLDRTTMSFTYLITGLSAGSHNFRLRWKTGAATLTLYAGAGTTNADVHPQFWVREVS